MSESYTQPSFFSSHAIDHACAGLGAGVVSVLCMHPLDLLKVKFQVATESPKGGVGKQIWFALKGIKELEGWRGLYRGVGPNIAGNASSWGLYFLFYNQLKQRAMLENPDRPLSAGQYLLCSAEASSHSLFRLCRYRNPDESNMGREKLDGFKTIYRSEGLAGLYRGTSLALVGVSNGALQFMTYEEMKRWAFERKKRQYATAGKEWTAKDEKLSNTAYTIMSGGSKLAALTMTYPYQPIAPHYKNDSSLARTHHRTIMSTVKHTWANEGTHGFYRGLGTNLVRVLPGTCVTFVVYENLAWMLKRAAAKREARKGINS
ncbi:hypothetical protein EW146_g6876 [Bondarzewia mesenterica]|uniref:Mitochondrial carrier n=1 Tax=Bondarzewia mesenterica TaxID=1095465 RepID=A0A4V3XEE2_9AGAM|nr:hypothetical protein EW146_g6876 [Bondarzewia mesenterica]